MPFAWAIEFSSGAVMKPATSAGSAPVYTVVTVTTAFCVRGNCSTGKSVTERRPSTSSSRLTTVASTGRRTKMSVNFIAVRSLVFWPGRRLVRRLHGVVDDDGGPVAQLELAGGDHRLAFLDAREHRDLVAALRADGDEALVRHLPRLAVRPLALLLDHEHGVAIRVEGDRGLRQGQVALRGREADLDFRVHARQQLAPGIGQRGAHQHVARRRIHLGVYRLDAPLELLAGQRVAGEHHFLPGGDLTGLVLRHAEVRQDRVERL